MNFTFQAIIPNTNTKALQKSLKLANPRKKKPPQFSLHKNNGNKSTNTKPPHFLKPNSTNPKFHKIFNNKKSIPRSKTKPEKENEPG